MCKKITIGLFTVVTIFKFSNINVGQPQKSGILYQSGFTGKKLRGTETGEEMELI